jgi:nicotinate-nucleotide adenylyltransferase
MSAAPRRDGTTVAVFGGSFDPPHAGHVLVPALVLSLTSVSRVLVVPCFRHPFGKEMAPFKDRVDLCRAAFKHYGRAVTVSVIEQRLARTGLVNWTVHTLDALAANQRKSRLRLVIGADVWSERREWRDFDRIDREYEPIVIGRQGYESPEGVKALPSLPDIRSCHIREALRRDEEAIPGLPRTVGALIRSRGLYNGEGQKGAGEEL